MESFRAEQILLVDRVGIVGAALVQELTSASANTHVTFVSKNKQLPTRTRFYSYIFVVLGENDDIEPVLSQKGKIILITDIFHNQDACLEAMAQHENVNVVVYGEVFGKNLPLDTTKPFGRLITSASHAGRVSVSDMLGVTYPVFLADVVSAITQAAFVDHGENRLFLVLPKHPPTQLAIARMVKKLYPFVRIDFSENVHHPIGKNVFIPKEGEFLLEDEYNVEEKLKELVILEGKNEGSLPMTRLVRPAHRGTFVFPVLLFLCLLILLPFIMVATFTTVAEVMLNRAQQNLSEGSISSSKTTAKAAENLFAVARILSPLAIWALAFEERVATGEENAHVLFLLATSIDTFVAKADFEKAARTLTTVLHLVYSLRAEKRDVPLPLGSDTQVALLRFFSYSLPIAQPLFGFDREKTYLVLLHDTSELRGGGGVVKAYAMLRIHRGRVTHFSLHDVSLVDGKLKGHVEPPFPIRRYASSVHWYLKDSLFSLDVAQNASVAALLLSLASEEKADGVIGVDSVFLSNVSLAVGSPDSKDLKEMAHTILEKLGGRKNMSYWSMLAVIAQAIEEKHLTFAFSESTIQEYFSAMGATPSLWDSRKEKQALVNDFIALNEANVGGSRARITRSLTHEVAIDKTASVGALMRILYKGGETDYKAYLRFAIPRSATALSISFNGVEQKTVAAVKDPVIYEAKRFIPPKELEVDSAEEAGKTVVGFLVLVPKDEEKTVALAYQLPAREIGDILSYDVSVRKQPGAANERFAFSLSYPQTLAIVRTSQDLRQTEGKVRRETELSKDLRYRIDFAKH